MPKRNVDTAIWADHEFSELSATAQLVYLRLITGDDTGPHGATRAPAKRIAVDTNLTRDQVDAAITVSARRVRGTVPPSRGRSTLWRRATPPG